MPGNDTARRRHARDHQRYPGDPTEAGRSVVKPSIPPAGRGGRPRTTDMRGLVNAILHIGGGGCQ